MEPLGGSNMLKALRRILSVRDVDSILLIVGSVPDQSMEILSDYMYQALLNRPSALHCVSYELKNHIVNVKFMLRFSFYFKRAQGCRHLKRAHIF